MLPLASFASARLTARVRIYPFLFALCVGLTTALRAADDYKLGADSEPQSVPRGEVRQAKFTSSKVFPGTTRDYLVYVPKQYDASKPACLRVFFDGAGMMRADGSYRVPVVFDNLIAKKEMPVTIAVAINPGMVPPTLPGAKPRSNRSFEYDSLGDANARFLLEELLPEATKGLNITKDPAGRAICGNSSGVIAFDGELHAGFLLQPHVEIGTVETTTRNSNAAVVAGARWNADFDGFLSASDTDAQSAGCSTMHVLQRQA